VELPTDLSVVAGAITLKQQNLLSHVQLKSRSRHTPNLDLSDVASKADILKSFPDGSWIHMLLGADGSVKIEKSDEETANSFYQTRKTTPVQLQADLSATQVFTTADLTWKDSTKVGTKAANYAELAKNIEYTSAYGRFSELCCSILLLS